MKNKILKKRNWAKKIDINFGKNKETLDDKIKLEKERYVGRNSEVWSAIQRIEVDIKEFIKEREARIRNQLRIHWLWLKNRPLNEVQDFIVAIANAGAGERLLK